MENEKTYRLGCDVIYLVKQALHEAAPDRNFFEKIDLQSLYKMAKFHSVDACVYLALKKAFDTKSDEFNANIETNIYKRFENSYKNSVNISSVRSGGNDSSIPRLRSIQFPGFNGCTSLIF